MNRRGFIASLLAVPLARYAAPLSKYLPSPPSPVLLVPGNWIRGDVFTIAGVHNVNPATFKPTAVLKKFVFTADTGEFFPQPIPKGQYRNVSRLPMMGDVAKAWPDYGRITNGLPKASGLTSSGRLLVLMENG